MENALSGHEFHFGDGTQCSTLKDLIKKLKSSDDNTIEPYIKRGDISRWIGNALSKKDLASKLKNTNDRKSIIGKIQDHIEKKKGNVMKDMYKDDLLAPGHRTCAGCGAAIAARQMLKALGKNVVICNATGCLEVTTTQYPLTSWKVPWIHVTFENAASVASGVREALDAQGKEDVTVVAIGGDGGMIDIGFRAFSGALERGHNILVICYDNEAYMNTGVQRSGATPWRASTSTTPAGKVSKGKEQWKKDVPTIAAAHHIPYVATASIGYPKDLEKKIKKALSIKGPKYIHIHSPCPVGWNYDSSKTIEIAKEAVESKMWALFEIEDGKKTLTHTPKGIPVSKYFKSQKRFRHLTDSDIKEYQKRIDESFKKEFSI